MSIMVREHRLTFAVASGDGRPQVCRALFRIFDQPRGQVVVGTELAEHETDVALLKCLPEAIQALLHLHKPVLLPFRFIWHDSPRRLEISANADPTFREMHFQVDAEGRVTTKAGALIMADEAAKLLGLSYHEIRAL